VHSTAEYCAPVWFRSDHTRYTDHAINDALQIATGCPRPTLANNLPILTGIQPAELRRKEATLSLARRPMVPGHLLHSALSCPSKGNARHLKSDTLLYPLLNNLSVHLTTITEVRWNAERLERTTRLRTFVPDPTSWKGSAKNIVGPAQLPLH